VIGSCFENSVNERQRATAYWRRQSQLFQGFDYDGEWRRDSVSRAVKANRLAAGADGAAGVSMSRLRAS